MAQQIVESKEIFIEDAKPGMVLAQPVISGKTTLVGPGFVLTAKLIDKFKKLDISVVYIKEKTTKKQDQPQKAGPGFSMLSKTFHPGDFVCFQNDQSEHIYMLEEGELDVIVTETEKISQELVEKMGKTVAQLKGKKVTFGEIGAILGTPRSASIRAVTKSQITLIPTSSKGLMATTMKNPKLGLSIAISLVRRLKDTNSKITVLDKLLKDVHSKVEYNSKAYLVLCNKFGQKRSANKWGIWLTEVHENAKRSPFYLKAVKYGKKKIEQEPPMPLRNETGMELNFDLSNIKDFDMGETICTMGEEGKEMYILTSGRLGVFIGEQRVATISKKGSIIGEIAVLLGYTSGRYEKRTATIKTVSAAQMIVIPGDNLENYLQRDPEIMAHITKDLAERLPVTNAAYMNTRNELMKLLPDLDCADEFGAMRKILEQDQDRISKCAEEYKLCSILEKKATLEYGQAKLTFDELEAQ